MYNLPSNLAIPTFFQKGLLIRRINPLLMSLLNPFTSIESSFTFGLEAISYTR